MSQLPKQQAVQTDLNKIRCEPLGKITASTLGLSKHSQVIKRQNNLNNVIE
jgi:hypothetical protein